MKHTAASRKLAGLVANAPFSISGYVGGHGWAVHSCAYASTSITNLAGLAAGNTNDTVYDALVKWVKHHRKPLLFTFSDWPGSGTRERLTKETLEVYHKQGKYPHVHFLMETEGWHGTKSVGLFVVEIRDDETSS